MMSDTDNPEPSEAPADADAEVTEAEPTAEAPATDEASASEEAPASDDAPAPAAASAPAAEDDDDSRSPRKIREGRVVSNGMQKTAVVLVTDRVRHPRYNKTVQRSKRLHVHDETDDLNLGDIVRVMETRPLSKTKRWRLVEVVERAR